MKRIPFILISAIFILAACSPTATDMPTNEPSMDNPISSDDLTPPQSGDFHPSPTDSNLRRENVYPDSTELLIMESYPLQFMLALKGNMPTPCNQLRIAASPPDAQNKIEMDVYSVVDPNTACAEMLQPFEVNFPLGSFPTGHYTLWMNGKQITEFDA